MQVLLSLTVLYFMHVGTLTDVVNYIAANLEVLIQMFCVLDSVGKIPSNFCEASYLV